MTTVFRVAVQVKLTEELKQITPANGFINDMSESVFRGRAVYGSNDPLPMLSIIEDPRERQTLDGPIGSSASSNKWRLLIQGFVKDDAENPTDPAYLLATDTYRRLVQIKVANRHDVLGFGSKKPCVTDITIGDPIVRPADDFSDKAYCWIPVVLDIVEDNENPYLPTP